MTSGKLRGRERKRVEKREREKKVEERKEIETQELIVTLNQRAVGHEL